MPGRALDQRRAALAGQRVAEQRAERGELAVALDERRSPPARPAAATGAAAAGAASSRSSRSCSATSAGPGRRPELLAQQHADVLVDAQRLGDVAARAQHLHQRRARGLAERRRLDRGARRALGLGLLRAAHRRAPRPRAPRAPPAAGRRARRGARRSTPPRARAAARARRSPAAPRCRRTPPPRRRPPAPPAPPRRPRAPTSQSTQASPGQDQCSSPRPDQPAVAERLAQPRQRRGERVAALGRPALRPQRLDELVAADRPVAVEHEVGEQQPALPPAQRAFDPPSLDLDRELSTELDAGPHWRATYRDTGVRSIGAGR